jgi:hypothetical protein
MGIFPLGRAVAAVVQDTSQRRTGFSETDIVLQIFSMVEVQREQVKGQVHRALSI